MKLPAVAIAAPFASGIALGSASFGLAEKCFQDGLRRGGTRSDGWNAASHLLPYGMPGSR
jgi:hypothetical protein